jgi:hypothetical protein
VCTVSPGIPGGALLDSQGRAAGVLSTLAVAPLAGSNNYPTSPPARPHQRRSGRRPGRGDVVVGGGQ